METQIRHSEILTVDSKVIVLYGYAVDLSTQTLGLKILTVRTRSRTRMLKAMFLIVLEEDVSGRQHCTD